MVPTFKFVQSRTSRVRNENQTSGVFARKKKSFKASGEDPVQIRYTYPTISWSTLEKYFGEGV